MPQEHYVLKCFSCETFQAHIVKKAKKWECKMCGVKQSVKRNYGKGSGKDCRNHVMKLNELRYLNNCSSYKSDESICEDDDLKVQEEPEQLKPSKPLTSKWADFLDEHELDVESEVDDDILDIRTADEEKNKKRVKKVQDNYNRKKLKICQNSDAEEVRSADSSHLSLSESTMRNSESLKTNEKSLTRNNQTPVHNQSKVSKYARYLDQEEEKSTNNSVKVKAPTNIFDSDPDYIDSVLTWE